MSSPEIAALEKSFLILHGRASKEPWSSSIILSVLELRFFAT
jgi:hypothetical protein